MHTPFKRRSLDPSVLSDFRPISRSKVLEKVVCNQFNFFLEDFSIYEIIYLRVFNDIVLAVDSRQIAVLVLLDLYSAFDTVSYSILLSQLEHFVGIKGTAMVQVFFV